MEKKRAAYVKFIKALIKDAFVKWNEVVFENPTNIGKAEIIKYLNQQYGKILLVSQSYSINRQWNDCPDIIKNMVLMTYNQLSAINPDDLYNFCSPYDLVIFDEAHHAGAERYLDNISRIIDDRFVPKVFGITTHTKRYSDDAEDITYSVFHGHKIDGMTFEDAIRKGLLPQFDYITALYGLPKDVDDIIASSSLAKRIVSDNGLVQINKDGIMSIVRKHMPEGNRKIVYFVPSIEDSEDAEKLAEKLGYGKVYAINYTKSDKENKASLQAYNNAETASLVCISKFNEGAVPKGTNTVVVLRKTETISIFERQILTALLSATEKPVVYDFVANVDNLIYSHKDHNQDKRYYADRIKSLCSQSIIVDYARQWQSVFTKIRNLSKNGWTSHQDELLRKYYPKYGNDIYRYIDGHNLQECILRAELLGIKYIEPKREPAKEKKRPERRPFTFLMPEMEKAAKDVGFPKNYLMPFCKAYIETLDSGHAPKTMPLPKQIDGMRLKKILMSISDACVNAIRINSNDADKIQQIKKNQEIFRKHVQYCAESYGKKSVNAVVVNGKVLSGQKINKFVDDQKRAEAEKAAINNNRILINGQYYNRKTAVAGTVGTTQEECSLYKTYKKLLLQESCGTKPPTYIKKLSPEEVVSKLTDLRNRRQNWTDDDFNELMLITKDESLYKRIMHVHSDLDILEKARETGDNKIIAYCTTMTECFERNYQKFLENYRTAYDSILEKERKEQQKKTEQQQKENERRKQKQKRLKELKTTGSKVMIVSKGKVVSVSQNRSGK